MVISTMLWRQDKQWALKCLNSRDALLLQCDCRSGRKMMPQERSMWLEGKLTVLCLATQSRLTLCDPMDSSLPGCSVHGIPQARILEWVSTPSSRGSSQPRDWTQVSCFASRFFAIWATKEVLRRIRDDAKVGGWRPRMMEFIFSERGSCWDGNKDDDGTYFTGLFWGWKVSVSCSVVPDSLWPHGL